MRRCRYPRLASLVVDLHFHFHDGGLEGTGVLSLLTERKLDLWNGQRVHWLELPGSVTHAEIGFILLVECLAHLAPSSLHFLSHARAHSGPFFLNNRAVRECGVDVGQVREGLVVVLLAPLLPVLALTEVTEVLKFGWPLGRCRRIAGLGLGLR